MLSVGLSMFAYFVEKDIIATTKPRDLEDDILVATSSMPRFQDLYSLKLVCKDHSGRGTSQEVSTSTSVGEYFDTEGYLAASAFKKDVKKLIAKALAEKDAQVSSSPKKQK